MSIVCGLDIHRKQLTFDWVDTVTGEAGRGQVRPADREHLAKWLAGFAGSDAHFAVEGCTGWRYVAEEIAAAGFTAHLGDPAEMAGLRGPRRHAKSDRADARLGRMLLEQGRLPECWIPPAQVLECRALLELYADLRRERSAWAQRIHATVFHHGAPALGRGGPGTPAGAAELAVAARGCPPSGQLAIAVAVERMQHADERLDDLRRRLLAAARHLTGARELQARLYGVGPLTALALCCWLGGAGRFSSARKAVRFAGLDITVHSSDGKRTRGHLSRQGPEVLRWLLFEAGKTHARAGAPGHGYYAAVKARAGGKPAALSAARRIVREACHILAELGDDALMPC